MFQLIINPSSGCFCQQSIQGELLGYTADTYGTVKYPIVGLQ